MSVIEENANKILSVLAKLPRRESGHAEVNGINLANTLQLKPEDVNDAVSILVSAGFAEWIRVRGARPYDFMSVWISPRGRYEYERALEKAASTEKTASVNNVSGVAFKPPAPVGSPYGFTDQDWEFVAGRKSKSDTLFVVLGHQFKSDYYELEKLRLNIKGTFDNAVKAYNELKNSDPINLDFHALSAGYGEHLFNEIARDIISADIAVFETSDLNPNVMVEMGVALTWGIRVLPIKAEGRPTPPSDISGQTWADYREDASLFVDTDHQDKLVHMVQRAARKKGRA